MLFNVTFINTGFPTALALLFFWFDDFYDVELERACGSFDLHVTRLFSAKDSLAEGRFSRKNASKRVAVLSVLNNEPRFLV